MLRGNQHGGCQYDDLQNWLDIYDIIWKPSVGKNNYCLTLIFVHIVNNNYYHKLNFLYYNIIENLKFWTKFSVIHKCVLCPLSVQCSRITIECENSKDAVEIVFTMVVEAFLYICWMTFDLRIM